MSVKLALSRGLELGRSFLHTGLFKSGFRAAAKLRPADRFRVAPPAVRGPHPRAFLPSRYRFYRTSLRGLAARMFAGGNPRNRTGLLAFGLGVALVGNQLEEDRRSVVTCQEIQAVFRKQRLWPRPPPLACGYRLEDYVVGRQIGKGSNAAVYEAAANVAPPTDADRKPVQAREEEEEVRSSCCSLRNFPLAIKMMWNFGASSSSASILRSMSQELVPAGRSALKEEAELSLDGDFGVVPRRVAPHPNVIRVFRAFTADVPLLPGAQREYPDILPARLNPHGLGNNRTMFLVMKHYPCTLRQYLSSSSPPRLHRVLMLLQLLEGVDHLSRNAIAHRDLKTDNVLLELDAAGVPRLVISDFGCCLSQSDSSLQLSFSSVWVDRGGNASLMAPEVSSAVPGRGVVIDYSKADVWAVGAMAYELLGQKNPFYGALESRRYREEELPAPVATATPDAQEVIRLLLRRSPDKRPSARVAANMLHLSVWGGRMLAECDGAAARKLTDWLLCRSAVALLQGAGGRSRVEAELQRSFLAHLDLEELRAAVGFLMYGRERRRLAAIESA